MCCRGTGTMTGSDGGIRSRSNRRFQYPSDLMETLFCRQYSAWERSLARHLATCSRQKSVFSEFDALRFLVAILNPSQRLVRRILWHSRKSCGRSGSFDAYPWEQPFRPRSPGPSEKETDHVDMQELQAMDETLSDENEKKVCNALKIFIVARASLSENCSKIKNYLDTLCFSCFLNRFRGIMSNR